MTALKRLRHAHHHRACRTPLCWTPLSAWLAVLIDALDGMTISDAKRASLTWLAGFEAHTVENVATVMSRARQP
jgi:hypothetical protein